MILPGWGVRQHGACVRTATSLSRSRSLPAAWPGGNATSSPGTQREASPIASSRRPAWLGRRRCRHSVARPNPASSRRRRMRILHRIGRFWPPLQNRVRRDAPGLRSPRASLGLIFEDFELERDCEPRRRGWNGPEFERARVCPTAPSAIGRGGEMRPCPDLDQTPARADAGPVIPAIRRSRP